MYSLKVFVSLVKINILGFKQGRLDNPKSHWDLIYFSVLAEKRLKVAKKSLIRDTAWFGLRLSQEALKERNYECAYYTLKWTDRLEYLLNRQAPPSSVDNILIDFIYDSLDRKKFSEDLRILSLQNFFSGLDRITLNDGSVFYGRTDGISNPFQIAARYLHRMSLSRNESKNISQFFLNEISEIEKTITQKSLIKGFIPGYNQSFSSCIPAISQGERASYEFVSRAANVLGIDIQKCKVIYADMKGKSVLKFEDAFVTTFPDLSSLLMKSTVTKFESPDGRHWYIYQWYLADDGGYGSYYWLCPPPTNVASKNRSTEHNLLLRNFGGVYRSEGCEPNFTDEQLVFSAEEEFLTADYSITLESYLDDSLREYIELVFAESDFTFEFDSKNWVKFNGIQSSDFSMYSLKHDGLVKFSFGPNPCEPLVPYENCPELTFYQYKNVHSFVDWVESFAKICSENTYQGREERVI